VLPPPRSELIPLVVLDVLLDLALLDGFTGVVLEGGISDTYGHPTRTWICMPNLPPLFFYLSCELFARK
jgi:hypothetical protein